MGDNTEVKTGSSSTKPPTPDGPLEGKQGSGNGGPIIEESQESEEYQQDLQVVLGTAFGVIAVFGLIALTFLLYRIYKARRQTSLYNNNLEVEEQDRDFTIDVSGKSQPVVLLLYAYDCSIHQRVIAALAGFLMEACGVTVTLDLLEENEIIERGIDDWLVDRLQEADYILVLCSLGARLRCSKKRIRFKADTGHVLPDYFAVAVDYVAEKMRAEKQKGMSMNKFVTAFMDYSTRSDIPPQLETAVQFCLMKDIHKLHVHFNGQGPESDKSDNCSLHSMCENHYHETETGALLKATVEQAKTFFKDNPTWMDDRLEPVSASLFSLKGKKSRKRRHNSLEQPLLMLTGIPPALHEPKENNSGMQHGQPQTTPSPLQKQQCQSINEGIARDTPEMWPESASLYKSLDSRYGLNTAGVFQCRQNSLPSSLASSGLVAPLARQPLSKSMDSFATDHCAGPDCEGIPCPFCDSRHEECRPECRQVKDTSLTVQCLSTSSQVSMLGTLSKLGPSRSQTVLQAEVHHEWEQPSTARSASDKKSATFGGHPHSCNSDMNLAPTHVYKSLPPHLTSPTGPDWSSPGQLRKWGIGLRDSPSLSGVDGRKDNSLHRKRTGSQASVSTDDSESFSDGDSLERDLFSVQNISSFHEFVNTTSFIPMSSHSSHPCVPPPEFELSVPLRSLKAATAPTHGTNSKSIVTMDQKPELV